MAVVYACVHVYHEYVQAGRLLEQLEVDASARARQARLRDDHAAPRLRPLGRRTLSVQMRDGCGAGGGARGGAPASARWPMVQGLGLGVEG